VPDLSLPEVREIILRQHEREHLRRGVGGYKLDECDGFDQWLWPDHARFPSGLSGEELRQVCGVLFQRLTAELYRRHDLRTYGLVRASNAGAVSFPYVIYSDAYSHREFITALCSSSLCGVLWTPEARGARSAEEWVRRMQTTCLSPLAMINAWADGTMPWSFPEVTEAVRAAMLLRQRLLPYLYSAFAQYQADGTPPFRAMVLEEGIALPAGAPAGRLDSTANPYALKELGSSQDQYMMGPTLLVAPLFEGQRERRVLLPPGRWFDFHTGREAGAGPGEITVAADLATIPILVRNGGIVPLMPPLLHAPDPGQQVDLEVRHYGEAPGCYELYDDDGLTLACERGEYCRIRLEVTRDAAGRLTGRATIPNGQRTFTYAAFVWRFMGDGTAGVAG
jgi:alpha-D-xyloside xylohydrolase